MQTRVIAPLVAAAAMTAALGGCGGGTTTGGGAGGDDELVVALVPPSRGPLAVFGSSAVKGWKLAAEEANAKGGVDGHRVRIVTLDTDGTPAATVRAARKAVTQEGARFISGIVTSGENAALAGQLAGMGAVNIISMSKDDALTGEQCSANAYRTTVSSAMDVHATAKALGDVKSERWGLVMSDIAAGHSAAKTFAAEARSQGKRIVSTQFPPLGTTDFGTYISKLKSSGADALYIFASGADGVSFIKQARQYRLFDQIKTVVGFSTVDDTGFDAVGKTVVGWYNNLPYAWNLDTPENQRFVAAYERSYDDKPFFIPAENYTAAQFLFRAVEQAGSTDVKRVKAAMDGLRFDGLTGPIEMRAADHQAVRNTFVGQIVEQGDGLGWKITRKAPPSQTTPEPDPSCRL
ncbi:ABC transporter substrate-binding protein [Patulibacter sp. S7RM1-6]